jgi:glutamate synthase domain-containing protein 3
MTRRTDLLEMNTAIDFWKSRGLDFSRILHPPRGDRKTIRKCTEKQVHEIDSVPDRELIQLSEGAIKNKEKTTIEMDIRNVHRTVGAMLSGEIAKQYGSEGLPDDTITCRFKGAAGQSFGAFLMKGVTFILEGEANDYPGKGLSGGKIIMNPRKGSTFDPSMNIISGNVSLYGATSGEMYINGMAGERFAIRNSGACAVVEGVGDHGCEYMTGGRVVILGITGVNFGAGMSGGLAYVYDEDRLFDTRCNLSMVDLEIVADPYDIRELHDMIQRHYMYTGSKKANFILEHWDACLPSFIKIFPMEYRRVLGKMMKEDEAVPREEVIHG